jgi:hypothetical protein
MPLPATHGLQLWMSAQLQPQISRTFLSRSKRAVSAIQAVPGSRLCSIWLLILVSHTCLRPALRYTPPWEEILYRPILVRRRVMLLPEQLGPRPQQHKGPSHPNLPARQPVYHLTSCSPLARCRQRRSRIYLGLRKQAVFVTAVAPMHQVCMMGIGTVVWTFTLPRVQLSIPLWEGTV